MELSPRDLGKSPHTALSNTDRCNSPTDSGLGHARGPGPAWFTALAILCTLSAFFLYRHAARNSIPFGDTITYIEPGFNLCEGRGFVTRFNIVYAWSGSNEHQAIAYYNPLYSLIIGTLWHWLRDTTQLAVAAAVLPAVLNIALLALLLRRRMGDWESLVCGAGYLILPGTLHNISLISAEHPSVTICLALAWVIGRAENRGRFAWVSAGALVGLGFLFKVTILSILPAAILCAFLSASGSIAKRSKSGLRNTALLLAGLAVVVAPFQIFCLIKVGRFYPEYPDLARQWSLASLYGGSLTAQSPAVVPAASSLPGAIECAGIVARRAGMMLYAAFQEIGWSAFLIPVGIWSHCRKSRVGAAWLGVGACLFLSHITAFYWMRDVDFRYAIYFTPFLYPFAVAGISTIVSTASASRATQAGVGVMIWAALSFSVIRGLQQDQSELSELSEPRAQLLKQFAESCRERTESTDLVALPPGGMHVCSALFMDRPVVILPDERLDTEENNRRFIEIFHPKLIVPTSKGLMKQVAQGMGYRPEPIPSFQKGRYAIGFVRP